jgi:Lon protease-like protein
MQTFIFPLNTVLYPGGRLQLRVFEQRYLEMTKQCLRDDLPFGVCLIREGTEVGAPAVPEAVGCLARIASWDMPGPNLFDLFAEGGERFRILERSVSGSGLITAEVEVWAPDPEGAPVDERCRRVLQMLIERIGPSYFPEPVRLDDAAWVGCRLAEILPLPNGERQALLELRDAGERLSRLSRLLDESSAPG